MYKIAICDDDSKICSRIENIVLSYEKKTNIELEVEPFYSGAKLCEYLKNGNLVDLIFLDIEMDELNGVEVGRIIRETLDNEITHIVYISWSEEYCRKLFNIRPLNFITKPFNEDDIMKTIDKARKLNERLCKTFIYKKGQDVYKVQLKDIIYFESSNREVKLVSINGMDTFYEQLDKIYEKLKKYNFFQIHKSILVNLIHVVMFKYDKLQMSNSDCLSISQSKRKMVRQLQLQIEEEEV